MEMNVDCAKAMLQVQLTGSNTVFQNHKLNMTL